MSWHVLCVTCKRKLHVEGPYVLFIWVVFAILTYNIHHIMYICHSILDPCTCSIASVIVACLYFGLKQTSVALYSVIYNHTECGQISTLAAYITAYKLMYLVSCSSLCMLCVVCLVCRYCLVCGG